LQRDGFNEAMKRRVNEDILKNIKFSLPEIGLV
jgi:hypothetical protein